MTDPYIATTLIAPYLSQLASPAPTPGGGSGSAAVGAIGAALVEMVINVTLRSTGEEEHDRLHHELRAANDARIRFVELGTFDERAYNGFRVALTLPKSSNEEKAARRAALESATIASAIAPLETAILAVSLLRRLPDVATISSPQMRSDLGTAAHLLAAAGRGAIVMVDTNLVVLKNEERINELQPKRDDTEHAITDALNQAIASLS